MQSSALFVVPKEGKAKVKVRIDIAAKQEWRDLVVLLLSPVLLQKQATLGKRRGIQMEIMSGRDALICRGNEVERPISEEKLWVAVLAQAVEDWQGDRLRSKREAEQFLFEDEKDFQVVCARAGVDPGSFRAQLNRLRRPQKCDQGALAA